MLLLNIIPDSLKQEIKLDKIFNVFKNYLYVVLILLITYTCTFLILKVMLNGHYNDTIASTNVVKGKMEDKTSKIKEINTLINTVESVQNDFIIWSNLLIHLGKLTNEGLNIKQLRVSKADNSISLSGKAVTRDALLRFKNEMEKSSNFSNINFPIKNLFEKENINFEISAKIKSYEFE